MKGIRIGLIGIIVLMWVFSFNCIDVFTCFPEDDVEETNIGTGDENTLGTSNPVILAHGMGGFDEIAGIHYWFGTKDYLESKGFTVYETQTSMFSSIENRCTQDFGYNDGRSFLEQIEYVVNLHGKKAIVIAHSMGGLDTRYLVSPQAMDRSDLVAALLSIGTPHRGTALADMGLGLIPDGLEGMLHDILVAFGMSSDQDYDAESFYDLTRPEMRAFNEMYFNSPDVKYFSIGGEGDGIESLLLPLKVTNPLDYIYEGPNDGLVSLYSARWGQYLGSWPADHGDEIGLVSKCALCSSFDYKQKIYEGLSDVIYYSNNDQYYNDRYSVVEY